MPVLITIEEFKKLAADKALAKTLTNDVAVFNESEAYAADILLKKANITTPPASPEVAPKWSKLACVWITHSLLLSVWPGAKKEDRDAAELNYDKAIDLALENKQSTPPGKSGASTGKITGLEAETW